MSPGLALLLLSSALLNPARRGSVLLSGRVARYIIQLCHSSYTRGARDEGATGTGGGQIERTRRETGSGVPCPARLPLSFTFSCLPARRQRARIRE